MATQILGGLDKLARLQEEQKIQRDVLPLDPEFPFSIIPFDPLFYSAEASLEDTGQTG
jgi:hypothetical protein